MLVWNLYSWPIILYPHNIFYSLQITEENTNNKKNATFLFICCWLTQLAPFASQWASYFQSIKLNNKLCDTCQFIRKKMTHGFHYERERSSKVIKIWLSPLDQKRTPLTFPFPVLARMLFHTKHFLQILKFPKDYWTVCFSNCKGSKQRC